MRVRPSGVGNVPSVADEVVGTAGLTTTGSPGTPATVASPGGVDPVAADESEADGDDVAADGAGDVPAVPDDPLHAAAMATTTSRDTAREVRAR